MPRTINYVLAKYNISYYIARPFCNISLEQEHIRHRSIFCKSAKCGFLCHICQIAYFKYTYNCKECSQTFCFTHYVEHITLFKKEERFRHASPKCCAINFFDTANLRHFFDICSEHINKNLYTLLRHLQINHLYISSSFNMKVACHILRRSRCIKEVSLIII